MGRSIGVFEAGLLNRCPRGTSAHANIVPVRRLLLQSTYSLLVIQTLSILVCYFQWGVGNMSTTIYFFFLLNKIPLNFDTLIYLFFFFKSKRRNGSMSHAISRIATLELKKRKKKFNTPFRYFNVCAYHQRNCQLRFF